MDDKDQDNQAQVVTPEELDDAALEGVSGGMGGNVPGAPPRPSNPLGSPKPGSGN